MPRIRFLFRLALVLCLCASTQSLLVIQGAFHLNRAAIAEALCVNKARPEMGCDGHCELMRRVHSHQEHERDQGAAMLDIALAVAAAESGTVSLPAPPARSGSRWAREGLREAAGETVGVWRPPRG